MSKPASIDLWFPLRDVAAVAEHAMAAPQHSRCPFADNDAPSAPSLIWTKNDGTFLWSNGSPRQLSDPADPASDPLSVHALGWGPGTGPAIGSTPVGGNDFHEYVALTDETPDGDTLIELIRNCPLHDGWLTITAMPGQFEIGFTNASPPGTRSRR